MEKWIIWNKRATIELRIATKCHYTFQTSPSSTTTKNSCIVLHHHPGYPHLQINKVDPEIIPRFTSSIRAVFYYFLTTHFTN